MYVCLTVCLSVCMSDCLSVCLSVCLFVCLIINEVCMSACLPACPSVCLYACQNKFSDSTSRLLCREKLSSSVRLRYSRPHSGTGCKVPIRFSAVPEGYQTLPFMDSILCTCTSRTSGMYTAWSCVFSNSRQAVLVPCIKEVPIYAV